MAVRVPDPDTCTGPESPGTPGQSGIGPRFLAQGEAVQDTLTGLVWTRIVVHDDPLSAEEHLKLGMAYESGGETERAASEYRLAGHKEPLARLYLGNVLFGQGQLGDAEAEYRAALKALPDNAEVLNNLAWLLCTRKTGLAEAEALAARAVSLDPARPAFRDTLKAIRAAQGQ